MESVRTAMGKQCVTDDRAASTGLVSGSRFRRERHNRGPVRYCLCLTKMQVHKRVSYDITIQCVISLFVLGRLEMFRVGTGAI